MVCYFDASALVKRYVREKGSTRVDRLLRKGPAATTRYSAVEIASALARRAREGSLRQEKLDAVLGALQRDLDRLLVVELSPRVVELSTWLLREQPLRAGDAVQLASCIHLGERLEEEITFVCYDRRLAAAASDAGATVIP